MKASKPEMSFLDHLEEIRWRLFKIALSIVLFAIPCGIWWKKIFDVVMIYPLSKANPKPHLIFTNPTEAVVLSFWIAVGGGIIFSTPVIFYQLWKFVAPGLYANEKKIILPTVIGSTVFFLSGILFCYWLLPQVLQFLTNYSTNRIDPYFKINDYFNFLLKLSIAFGIVFELPVISFVLTRVGVLTHGFLIRHIRIAVVLIFVVAALLTPPDIFSQCIMAAPLVILYGVSILISYLVRKKPA